MDALSGDEVRRRVDEIAVWKREDERAPHKPLLLLLALTWLRQGKPRLISFAEFEKPLSELIGKFSNSKGPAHPEYPFWRLQADKLWEVPGGDALVRRASNSDPKKSELLGKRVRGGFPEDVHRCVMENSALFDELVASILVKHFSEPERELLRIELGLR
jgi:putative restriction endonuclease